MKTILFALLISLSAAFASHTPAPGSSERKAIMDAIRTTDIYKDAALAKQNPAGLLYIVNYLRVEGGWAVANVTLSKDGKPIADPFWALLQNGGGGWQCLNYVAMAGPYRDESESLDALDMSRGTVARLIKRMPGIPTSIFPGFQ